MRSQYFTTLLLLVTIIIFNHTPTFGQNINASPISGHIYLDDSWGSTIYLSYIPTYEDMHLMSDDMIVAEAEIDSLGYFDFEVNFLPEEEKLYRLHIAKKGDSRATLIIGGRNENHFFLIASSISEIIVSSSFSYPPFKRVTFENSPINVAFQKTRDIVSKADSSFSKSSTAKRLLIEKNLEKDLLTIADTSSFHLVSLLAIYESKFKENYSSNTAFYNTYLEKWETKNDSYFKAFRKQIPSKADNSFILYLIVILILCIALLLIFFKSKASNKKKNLKTLSLQERKVFNLLRKGATNQEISDEYLISVSTVKSHVSSIYSKLNVKSRKDIMNLEL